MRKVFAIAWKDAVTRFSSKAEWLFFFILPITFTFLIAGGVPSGDDDDRIRLLVVDESQTSISRQIVSELETSTAIRAEMVTREDAESQFDDLRASVVFTIPA